MTRSRRRRVLADSRCRNHGACAWCRSNRTVGVLRHRVVDELRESAESAALCCDSPRCTAEPPLFSWCEAEAAS